jgi:hypothetical protein
MVVIRGHLDVRSPVVPVDQNIIWNGAVNPINCEKHLFDTVRVVQILGQKPWFIAEKNVKTLVWNWDPPRGLRQKL